MKKQILFISLLFTCALFSQTGPGGVGNSSNNELWLIAENNSYSNAGTTQGVNNSAIQQWNDVSGNSNNATESTTSERPILKTNNINGYSSLYFDGNNDRLLANNIATNNQLTLFVVFDYNSTNSSNSGLIQAGPNGTAFISNPSDKSIGVWIDNGAKKPWGRGVQSNSSIRNISKNIVINENQFYTLMQDYDGSNIRQYIDGNLSGNISYNNTLKSWTDFGIGRQSGETLKGNISEIIVFKEHLNNTKQNIINNYIAAKYGLSTVNELFSQDNTANGDFDHHVAGIGQETTTDNHLDSKGSGIIQINTPSSISNGDYLFWGENQKDGTYDFSTTTDYAERLTSTWRVSKVNDLGTVSLSVNASDLDLSAMGTCSTLQLVVSNSATFTTKTVYDLTLTGGVYSATNISFTDGDYFSFEYHSDIVLDNTQFYNGSGTNFSPDVTDECYSFLIKSNATGSITLSNDAKVKDIEVETGGVLVVDGNYKLEVLNGIQLDGDIRLLNGAQLVQTHTGLSQVTGTGKLYIALESELTNIYQSAYWSSPVASSGTTFTVNDVMKDGTTTLTATSTPVNINFTSSYDGAAGNPATISNYWLANLTNALDWNRHRSETTSHSITQGYNMKGSGVTNQGFVFVGKPNDGDYSSSITSGNSSLLGNPYPSAMDADQFITDNSAIFNTLYFWDGTKDNSNSHTRSAYLGGYATRVVGMGTAYNSGQAPTQFIPVGQGFFVDATSTGTINFNNAQRAFSTATSNYRSSNNLFPILRIGFEFDLDGAQNYHRELAVGFRGLTNNYEAAYDAIMYDMRPTDIALQVNNHANDFVITGIEDFNDALEIPLHVRLDQQREVAFKIDALENFSPNEIYLKDALTNLFHNLENTVLLDLPAGDYTNRFSVTFTNNSTANTVDNELQSQLLINQANDVLTITSNQLAIKQVSIHSILGQLLVNKKGSDTQFIIKNNFKKGQLLLIKTELENGQIILNKIINK